MDSIVVSRNQRNARIAVRTTDGKTLVGTFILPKRIRNRQKIPLSKQLLAERIPGGHNWPEGGITVRVLMPNWLLRNSVVLVLVVAGLIGRASLYAGLLVLVWGGIAFCSRHRRLHSVVRFDPRKRGFWVSFGITLASTATIYLAGITAVIGFYLLVAMVFTFRAGTLTAPQLVDIQRSLSTVSEFYDNWIKLKEGPMFLALAIVWLLTCLLLSRRGHQPKDIQSARYRLARALNRTASFYGKHSGPVAVVLTVLASFTFLTNVSDALGTQLELRAVASTDDYRFAAKRIEADLGSEVVSQLYTQLRDGMPASYRKALAASDPLSDKVSIVNQDVSSLVVPLAQSDPADARRLAIEERIAQHADGAPSNMVIDAPRDGDQVDVPHELDMTIDQTAAAEAQADSDLNDDRDEIIDESGHEVLIQIEKVASEPAWNSLKNLVAKWFPIDAPMVDALAEACDEQLQETLNEKVPELVKQFSEKTVDIRASIANAARSVVATVDVPQLIHRYAAAASKLVAGQHAGLIYLANLNNELQLRNEMVQDIIDGADNFYDRIEQVAGLSDHKLQTGVVDDLRATMLSGAPDDPSGIGQHNAAVAIHTLGTDGVSLITQEDIDHALPLCGCLH